MELKFICTVDSRWIIVVTLLVTHLRSHSTTFNMFSQHNYFSHCYHHIYYSGLVVFSPLHVRIHDNLWSSHNTSLCTSTKKKRKEEVWFRFWSFIFFHLFLILLKERNKQFIFVRNFFTVAGVVSCLHLDFVFFALSLHLPIRLHFFSLLLLFAIYWGCLNSIMRY